MNTFAMQELARKLFVTVSGAMSVFLLSRWHVWYVVPGVLLLYAAAAASCVTLRRQRG